MIEFESWKQVDCEGPTAMTNKKAFGTIKILWVYRLCSSMRVVRVGEFYFHFFPTGLLT